MAILQVNFVSSSLMRTVPMNVILPVDKLDFSGAVKAPDRPYKTLYLLHGILGNYTDWLSGTCIQRWAEAKNLAVVMPSGDNAFYVDQPEGHNYYGKFIGQELVEITRRMFPLSHERSDTFIAGLSMGGYGALRNGLKYYETFGAIAGLSAATMADGLEARTNAPGQPFMKRRDYAEQVFGDLSRVKNSDKDLVWLAQQLAACGAEKPKIYLTCGVGDSLLEPNRKLRDSLRANGFNVTYEEGPGAHEWDFWNRSIQKVVDWLPLEDTGSGMNSGNIGDRKTV